MAGRNPNALSDTWMIVNVFVQYSTIHVMSEVGGGEKGGGEKEGGGGEEKGRPLFFFRFVAINIIYLR